MDGVPARPGPARPGLPRCWLTQVRGERVFGASLLIDAGDPRGYGCRNGGERPRFYPAREPGCPSGELFLAPKGVSGFATLKPIGDHPCQRSQLLQVHEGTDSGPLRGVQLNDPFTFFEHDQAPDSPLVRLHVT